MIKQISKARELLVLGTVFLFPIAVADTFIDKIGLPKLIILVSLLCLVFLSYALEFYVSGKIKFAKSKLDFPILIIIGAYLISGIFVTPNKLDSLFFPGATTLVLSLGLLYLLLNTIENKNNIKITLIASSVFLSLITVSSFLGIFDKISFLPNFMKGQAFNPTGDYMTGAIFLASTIPLAVFFVIKETDLIRKLVFAISLAIILIASGISLFALFGQNRKNAPILPPFVTSWSIAVDTIKESPIFGIGPGNYLTAFNRFRPITYNQTTIWQIKFQGARNWYLNVVTETGLLGLLGIILLLITLVNSAKRATDPISLGTLATLLLVLVFLPATPVTLVLLFTFFSLNSKSKNYELSLMEKNTTARLVCSLLVFSLFFVLCFRARPIILAEAKFKEVNDALLKNDGKKTYDLLVESINLNPYQDRYHATLAQVNLALVRSIVSSVKDTKDLTDSQKNTILQLIQQAIKEGQNTVALNPTRSANWQVLANVYQTIIPYAAQADQFAIDSYTQTVNLDPIDPELRIALGGLYYSLGKYDEAVSIFQSATYAKPDLANAYYNLSAAYAAKNDFDKAITAMNNVLSLVPKDSNDYKTAQSDLENLKQKKSKINEETKSGSNLSAPKKAETSINPQLTLPEEATPPAAPNIPSPSPLPSPAQ